MSSTNIKSPESGDEFDGLDDFGLGDLISGHTVQRKDTSRPVDTTSGYNPLQEAFVKYKRFQHQQFNDESSHSNKKEAIQQYLSREVTEVFSPEQISAFFQVTMVYEGEIAEHLTEIRRKKGTSEKKDNISLITEELAYRQMWGTFITHLIQLSYNNRYNNFTLNTACSDHIQPIGLCQGLIGTADNLVNVVLNRNCGMNAAREVEYVSVKFEDYVDVGSCCGAKHSSFIFNGEVHMNWGCDKLVEDCTFKTPVNKILTILLKNIPKGNWNKIYFIHPDGREELKMEDYKIK